MAISTSPKNNFGFFNKISETAAGYADELVTQYGATVDVQFQAIKVTHGGKIWMHPMPVNSTAVIKETVPAELAHGLIQSVNVFLAKCLDAASGKNYLDAYYTNHGGGKAKVTPPTVPPPDTNLHWNADGGLPAPKKATLGDLINKMTDAKVTGITDEKMINVTVDILIQNYPAKVIEAAFKAKPPLSQGTEPVLALKDATMLNQPVRGSSPGSVYKVVAIGERMKIACRLKSDQLSVRVEGPLLQIERTAFVSLGFTENLTYLSGHFQLNGVPAERVLGCIFFHQHLKFIYKISSMKDVGYGS